MYEQIKFYYFLLTYMLSRTELQTSFVCNGRYNISYKAVQYIKIQFLNLLLWLVCFKIIVLEGDSHMTQRQQKMNELMRQEISNILLKEFKDPRLGFVTITRCEVSSDFSYCKVFISALGEESDIKKNLKILNGAADFIRVCVSNNIKRMRYVPVFNFRFDDTIEETCRLLRLMEQDKDEHKY